MACLKLQPSSAAKLARPPSRRDFATSAVLVNPRCTNISSVDGRKGRFVRGTDEDVENDMMQFVVVVYYSSAGRH